MEGPLPFGSLLRDEEGAQVLRVSGEIDLHSTARFEDVLEKAAAAERVEGPLPKVLVVDLSETGFMDSVGLGTLMGAARRFQENGGEIG